MYVNKILLQSIGEADFNQTTQSEIKLDEVSTSDAVFSVEGGAFVFVLVSAGFVLILSKVRSFAENNKVTFPSQSLHKLPCRNCRYFSNNHFLQCAVQPSIVLTEEAMNCSEYCPKKHKFLK
jgi:hypothetical protein